MSIRVIDQLEHRRLLAAEVFDLSTAIATSNVADVVDLNGVAIFTANDGVSGKELWRSDGTEAGTYLVKDITPGSGSSFPSPLTILNGSLYFAARGELWRTDGTPAGTALVSVVPNGSVSSGRGAAVVNGLLFFTASQTGTGEELWVSDGTSSGTHLVKDIRPGSSGGTPQQFTAAGDLVYFEVNDGVSGVELWRSNGTEAGTYLTYDISSGTASSNPRQITAFQGLAYFIASDANSTRVLWRTDGTTAGTTPFAGYSNGSIDELEASSSYLYFDAVGQLNRTDGTINGTISLGINASSLTDVDGALYFNRNGSELWKTTGTSATNTIVAGFAAGGLENLYEANGSLFFTANGTSSSIELWRVSDNPVSVSFVKLHDNGGLDGGFDFARGVGNRLFYRASTPSEGVELYCSDGTPQGTGMVKDIRKGTGDSKLNLLGSSGQEIRFTNYVTGYSLWRSNGATPELLSNWSAQDTLGLFTATLGNLTLFSTKTFYPPATVSLRRTDGSSGGSGILASFPGTSISTLFFGALGDRVFFNGASSTTDVELWVTDGMPGGTHLFKDLNSGPAGSNPRLFAATQDRLFFYAFDATRGTELWVTDGTESNTVPLELRSGSTGAGITSIVAVNNEAFFTANDGVNGTELWKSDGTPAGTVLVKDINSTGSSNPTSLVNANGTLYFLADDGVNGQELWKSDGTPAGTVRVSDVVPGAGSGTPQSLVASGSIALFTADDGVHGRELWRSDGTAAGTYLLRDISPGIAGSEISTLTSTGGHVYFGANDGVHGLEVWRSDGTVAGTMLIADIFTGPADSAPGSFLAAGDSLYFAANDLEHGRELWRLSADFVPPTVQSAFEFDANPMQVSLAFSEALASPFSAADFELLNVTTGQPIEPSMLLVSNNGLSTTIRFTTGELPDGEYRLTIPEGTVHDTSGIVLSADYVLNFFSLAADANRDRIVDTQDFNRLAANFGGGNKVFSQGNFNYDAEGLVDSADFNLFIAQYGKKLPAPGAALTTVGMLFGAQQADTEDPEGIV